jgi:type IV secretory pathway TrbL component
MTTPAELIRKYTEIIDQPVKKVGLIEEYNTVSLIESTQDRLAAKKQVILAEMTRLMSMTTLENLTEEQLDEILPILAAGARALGGAVAQGAKAVGGAVAQGAATVGSLAAKGAQTLAKGVSTVGQKVAQGVQNIAKTATPALATTALATPQTGQSSQEIQAAIKQLDQQKTDIDKQKQELNKQLSQARSGGL